MPSHAALRLITLDLDDTLWPCAPVIRDAEDALFAWLQARTPSITAAYDPNRLREHRLSLLAARPELAHDVTAARLEALRALMSESGYPQTLAEEAMTVFRRARNRVAPYDDVMPALSLLRGRYRLVAVTNGNAEVAQTPLADSFHHSLNAAEAGAAKPAPALFELAMQWAGASPAQTLHVGDDPVRDVDAARRIGLGAVWVNRDGRPWPDDLEPPVHAVTDLHGLVSWLERSQGAGADQDAL
jgi:putative hydrolase of the HAD superfamily